MYRLVKEMLHTIEAYRRKAGIPPRLMRDGVSRVPPIEDIAAHFKDVTRKYARDPVELEHALGLHGLSQKYRFPTGLSPRLLETWTLVVFHHHPTPPPGAKGLNAVFDMLAAHNPSLQKLAFDRRNEAGFKDVFRGIATGVNVSDIQFYMKMPYPQYTHAMKNTAYAALRKKLRKTIDARGGTLSWLPSIATMHKIERQLEAGKKPARKPPTP